MADQPIDRVRRALDGKPTENAMVQVGEDAAGNPTHGYSTPLATVFAADILALTDAIPKDKRSQVVKDLRLGSFNLEVLLKKHGRTLPPDYAVQVQCQDLAELVRAHGELKAAEVAPGTEGK